MKLLGMLSGLICDLDEKEDKEECCVGIPDEIAKDQMKIAHLRNIHSVLCLSCRGCPMYAYKLEDEKLYKTEDKI